MEKAFLKQVRNLKFPYNMFLWKEISSKGHLSHSAHTRLYTSNWRFRPANESALKYILDCGFWWMDSSAGEIFWRQFYNNGKYPRETLLKEYRLKKFAPYIKDNK